MRRRHLLLWGAGAALAPPRLARAYGLDEVSRRVPEARIVYCPKLEFVSYRGTHLRYSPRAEVYVEFRERLARFERLAIEVGREFYGRGPVTLLHVGARLCRRTRQQHEYFSEHAFGNALDFVGFDFAKLGGDQTLPAGTHRAFRSDFGVRVGRDWKPQPGIAGVHSRFLRTLMQRLIARTDIFRVLLGASHPGHRFHFHFDCAPERRVDVFEDESGSG